MKYIHDKRWEHGSDFHLLLPDVAEVSKHPWTDAHRLYASGRDAMHALLMQGQEARGWKRLLVPSYYCQQVVESFKASGIDICLYEDGPGEGHLALHTLPLQPGDVLLVVNFFGLDGSPDYQSLDRKQVEIIEDHSHDPWSDWAYASRADWCVASLRKALPLPDGGALWSPIDHRLPPQPEVNPQRSAASASRLAGMMLKMLYLEGYDVDKHDFRTLSFATEASFCEPGASGMTAWSISLMRALPVAHMRGLRRRNFNLLDEALAGMPGLQVLHGSSDQACCPFSCVLRLDSSAQRDQLRAHLLRAQIYPAVLWPLEKPAVPGIPGRHLELSRRLLSLHCDIRYSDTDMLRVAAAVRAAQRPRRHAETFSSDELASIPCKQTETP
jgi:hypothetical protein